MTANYIAKVVESLYNKVDIDKILEGFNKLKKYHCGRVSDEWANRQITEKSFIRWYKAIGILETYCRDNFATFEETELVYKWAKEVCDRRNYLYNQWRVYGGYSTFEQWLKKR